MEEEQGYQKDIESIRKMMERSVKLISLSGLSGIMAGTYALAGAGIAYWLLHPGQGSTAQQGLIGKLEAIALAVFVASVASGYWLNARKSKRVGVKVWDTTSQRFVINLAIPLATGGIFILILITQGYVDMVAPACLIFYGLALLNASPNVYEEVRYLGYSEIILGLICACLPGYGLVLWALGFGVLHILYGAVMYKKYDA
jgi:hypothetical protein